MNASVQQGTEGLFATTDSTVDLALTREKDLEEDGLRNDSDYQTLSSAVSSAGTTLASSILKRLYNDTINATVNQHVPEGITDFHSAGLDTGVNATKTWRMSGVSNEGDSMFAPGDDYTFGPHAEQNWAPLGLLTIIIISFVGNSIFCLAVKMDNRLHHMTYYFFASMAFLHILMSAILMPPAILITLKGEFEYTEELCKLWITLDLFFCNNTCLHLAFTNMDTFLRLKDPLRHGHGTTTCSLVLWIGASWIIAFVQGIAQFMLSQADHGITNRGICFIADKNFVILGTLFSFIIPVVISITFYGLCLSQLKILKEGKFLDESEASQNMYQYGSNDSIADDISDSTSCGSDTVIESMPSERVQLAVVTNMKDGEIQECVPPPQQNAIMEETTSFYDHPDENKPEGNGHAHMAFTEHILSTDQSASCTLLLRDPSRDGALLPPLRPNAEDDHDSPDETLRQEIAISRLMFVLLLFCITMWIPFAVSNIVYGVCANCRQNMSFDESMTFKWLAYSSAMIGPVLYIKSSEQIRDAFWSLCACRYCKWNHQ